MLSRERAIPVFEKQLSIFSPALVKRSLDAGRVVKMGTSPSIRSRRSAWKQSQQVRVVFHAGPQAVKQSIQVERVAQVIRMRVCERRIP